MSASTSTRVPVRAIHHFAYKCRNAEETLNFYENVLGIPLALVVQEDDVVTTTGDKHSFAHFFFEMKDGNYIAFFDFGDDTAAAKDPNTPAFANHLAMQIDGEEDLQKAMANLKTHGIEFVGPLEHEFVRSIYFWDPNGVRLEYAYTISDAKDLQHRRENAHAELARWVEKRNKKKAARQAAE